MPFSDTAEVIVARARIEEAELNQIYEAIKTRLGTAGEQPNDIHAVAEICHQLKTIASKTAYPLPPSTDYEI